MPIFTRVVKYCAQEVERQKDGPMAVFHMFSAWQYCADLQEKELTEKDIRFIASLVNGSNGLLVYRQMPAVFNQGIEALAPEHIPRQMQLLVENGGGLTSDHYCKRFLDIHPFSDGNGRTASLIRNFLNGGLYNPEMLPYYYGQEGS